MSEENVITFLSRLSFQKTFSTVCLYVVHYNSVIRLNYYNKMELFQYLKKKKLLCPSDVVLKLMINDSVHES